MESLKKSREDRHNVEKSRDVIKEEELIAEIEDRQCRSNNLIPFNLSESSKTKKRIEKLKI